MEMSRKELRNGGNREERGELRGQHGRRVLRARGFIPADDMDKHVNIAHEIAAKPATSASLFAADGARSRPRARNRLRARTP
jgi:hypothetical protein